MKLKKILFGVLAITASAMLSLGVAACDFSAIGGGTSNGNGSTTSSSSVNGGEKDSSSENSRESGSETGSSSGSSSESSSETGGSSESSSESSSDDKKDDSSFDDSDYETDCVLYTISTDGLSASVTGYTGSPTKVKILSTYQNVPVTSIGDYAFSNCISLTSVVIPGSVTSIGRSAFNGCHSLTSVIIPDSVTSIGEAAFDYCNSLTSIKIPDSVTSIGVFAFNYCSRLMIYCEVASQPSGWDSDWNWNMWGFCPVVWDCNNNDVADDGYVYTVIDGIRYGIKDGKATVAKQPRNIQTANIPANITYKNNTYSVTTIGSKAFYYCDSLTSIVIPESVTIIGSKAFYNCSSLSEVYYNGTEGEWKIFSDSYNDKLTSATRYYYSEEEPTEEGNYWHYVDGVVTKW